MVKNMQLVLLFAVCISHYVTHGNIRKLPTAYHYDVSGTANDWWSSAVFYQIYPRSFKDSDGNGDGDLPGIRSKLQYLKSTGVTATWLSPIFQSPQIDQGYDISDYYKVDPMYGTTDDLKKLIAAAKALNLKLILDLVPNHTSDKHKWFQMSENKVEGYEDFYIWHDGYVDDKNASSRRPPNNWISNFTGSAWTWSEKRKQFYYHAFEYRQPDLNYANSKVVESMKDVMTYWLNQGVDGFRIDAVPFLFEDPNLRDEPLAEGYAEYNVNDYNCLDHKYTKDLNQTFELIYQFRDLVDNYNATHNSSTKVIITEAYSSINKTMLFYGSKDGLRKGAHFTFNFNFISYLSTNFTVDDIIYCIDLWQSNVPRNCTSNWVLGNHDNHRVATRLGKENVDAFNMLLSILPGVMVTYNGEEIGMENGEVTCEQGHDPQAIKNCSIFDKLSRDFERTPYQWDNSTNAGFSTANVTWLPVSKKYLKTNVAAQIDEGDTSHYGIYKDLLSFRNVFKIPEQFDTLTVNKIGNNILEIIRRRGNREYTYFANFGQDKEEAKFWNYARSYEVIVATKGSIYKKGDIIESVVLKEHESLLLQKYVAFK